MSAEQEARAVAEADPSPFYEDERPKMHRHFASWEVHADGPCSMMSGRRRVYVFDRDALDEHEAAVRSRALAEATDRRFPCCPHCEDAKADHVEHGGEVPKNGHDLPCSICESESDAYKAGHRDALAEATEAVTAAMDSVALGYRPFPALADAVLAALAAVTGGDTL